MFSVSGNCCPSIVASCCSIEVTSLTIALRACTSVARYESRPAQRVCMACIVAIALLLLGKLGSVLPADILPG